MFIKVLLFLVYISLLEENSEFLVIVLVCSFLVWDLFIGVIYLFIVIIIMIIIIVDFIVDVIMF